MRHHRVSLLLLVVASGAATAQEPAREFLSWYDGWGTHTVWGFGKVQGSYYGTFVTCGSVQVPVRAIYDTHDNTGPAKQPESSERAR